MMLTVSHVRYPTEFAISFAPRGLAGSGPQLSRCGFRRPYAQISGRAPLVLTNGLSFGTRYRPFSLTELVAACSFKSGMMRMIFPTRLSSRCGLLRMATTRDSPEAPSPTSQYNTRQSASPCRAKGLKVTSPIGWLRVLRRTRINSRAVPSNVVFAVFVSVHSISTPSLIVLPGVLMVGVTVYPSSFRPGCDFPSGSSDTASVRIFHVHRVELAGATVVGIEMEAVEAIAVAARDEEAVEQSGPIAAAVEVQIFRPLFGLFIQDVERPVHVGDEQPRGAAGLFPNRVDPARAALRSMSCRAGHQ